MTDLLIAFVIPILVIVISAILQTLLKCPFKVAGIVFVIAIIVAIVLGGSAILIALAWGYTILAFIVAFIICKFFRWECSDNSCTCCPDNNDNTGNNNDNSNNDDNNNSNRCCRCCRCRRG